MEEENENQGKKLKDLAEKNFKSSKGNPRIEFRLREIARHLIPGKVLDIGCRDGYFQKFLGPEHEYYGVDIVEDAGKNIKNFYLANVRDPLPFEDGFFDNVVAGEFLEHISNFYYTMGEITRVLRPGFEYGRARLMP